MPLTYLPTKFAEFGRFAACAPHEAWHCARLLSPELYRLASEFAAKQALTNIDESQKAVLKTVDPKQMSPTERASVTTGAERMQAEKELLGLPSDATKEEVDIARAANRGMHEGRDAVQIFAALARHYQTPRQNNSYDAGWAAAKQRYSALWQELNSKK